MKPALWAVMLLAVSGSALAALQPPTDIDLKAAYCTRFTKTAVANLQAAAPPFNAIIAEAQDRLNRLQSYLLPRMQYLDATGIVLAAQRADVDRVRYGQLVESCMPNLLCPQGNSPDGCLSKINSCIAGELQTRVEACSKLDWLPF